MNYSGKVVVITGASSGIGRESALKFAKLHASIVLVSRNKNKLEEVAKELSKFQTQVLVCACDISQKGQVDQMSKQVLEKFGTVDILVNNAGFGIYGNFNDLKVEEVEAQMATNYLGMIYCTKAFLSKMLTKIWSYCECSFCCCEFWYSSNGRILCIQVCDVGLFRVPIS